MTVNEAFDGLVPAFEACTNDCFDELVETLASQTKVEHPSITRARPLLEDDVSLDRVWQELNESHPTPQTAIEAIVWCVRERGLPALEEPSTSSGSPAVMRWQWRRSINELQKSKVPQMINSIPDYAGDALRKANGGLAGSAHSGEQRFGPLAHNG